MQPLQPTFNIGTLGAVSNGKSTLVKALTGIATQKYSDEKKKGITIRLGYANMKIWKCEECPAPSCYQGTDDSISTHQCALCGKECLLKRYLSICDCPGHQELIATMLNGAATMNFALLIVSADLPCPQLQTEEHLIAAEIMGLKNFLIVQTKIDLVKEEAAKENHKQIIEFVKNTSAEGAPIIPICSHNGANVDHVIQYLAEIPEPVFDLNAPLSMQVVRSFDINRPGVHPSEVVGGVLGGSILHGVVSVGDIVEIRPGLVTSSGYKPLTTSITAIKSGDNVLQSAKAGGLIALETELDPCLCKSDRMVGCVVGRPGQLPDVYSKFTIKHRLLKQMVGETTKMKKITIGETIRLHINSMHVNAKVTFVGSQSSTLTLETSSPVCIANGSRVSLSRKSNNKWRLAGCGEFSSGEALMPLDACI